jgi:hypothetical protein
MFRNENTTNISEKAAASCLTTEIHFDCEADSRFLRNVDSTFISFHGATLRRRRQ